MNKESMKIERYLDGLMDADEKLAFDRELGADPFLAEAVEGFRSDPQALLDLPVQKVSVHAWWAFAGLGVVVCVFVILSRLFPTDQMKEVKVIYPDVVSEKISESVPSKESDVEKNSTTKILDSVQPEESENRSAIPINSERKPNFSELKFIPKRPTEGIEKQMGNPKIKINSGGTYILDLKVAKTIERPSNKWRFVYGVSENNVPAQYENAESLRFNTQIIQRYNKVENPTYRDELTRALAKFKKKDFIGCLKELNKMEAENPPDLNAVFYSGLCQYRLGEYDSAIRHFKLSENADDPVFKPESKWYRALSLWKSGRKSQACKLFSEIETEAGFYAGRTAKMSVPLQK